jgi:hypothetical protein
VGKPETTLKEVGRNAESDSVGKLFKCFFMKSIKTKIAGFLAMLCCMLLLGKSASAQLVEGKPTQEKITQLLSTSDAKLLSTYLTRQGYAAIGLNNEGTATLSNPEDAAFPFNTIAVTDFRNSAGNVMNLYTHSEIVNGVETLVTRAEDDNIELRVVGGAVTPVAKRNSIFGGATVIPVIKDKDIDWAKLWDCLKKNYKGCVNMQPCFDCIRNCFNNNKKIWKKLWCSLGCSSCYNCVLSIAKVVWCYFS